MNIKIDFKIAYLLLSTLIFVGSVSAQAAHKRTSYRGLNVVILGDSNTSMGGDDGSNHKSWDKWFAKELGAASCMSYARSGATWTHADAAKKNPVQNAGALEDDNVVYSQIVQLIEAYEAGKQPKPTLIIIAAGADDAWFVSKRPGLLSRTPNDGFNIITTDSVSRHEPVSLTSLAEAVVYDCMLLNEAFPDAKIVIITPLQSAQITPERLARVAGVLEDCSSALGIDVIRQDIELPVDRNEDMLHKKLTYDGTHTSAEGAATDGHILAQRIAGILSKP
ncbi:MAG: SGNH/GDSL hydrolase family protein [Roseburia sp.]|nr:SGNH/GDSL hydrolase family protein [Roseburia sp.]